MSSNKKGQRPLSSKKRGYLLAILGGTLGGQIGWITSPLVLYLLNKKLKESDEKQPNRFKYWALIGLIGAPLSMYFSILIPDSKNYVDKVEVTPWATTSECIRQFDKSLPEGSRQIPKKYSRYLCNCLVKAGSDGFITNDERYDCYKKISKKYPEFIIKYVKPLLPDFMQ
ncbi:MULTISPECIES: hypothetical protein [Prochlorococcus]|uniref:hypothetical protein n=1 Tax=Prochlorococcus TaxID=1218 RepID=UPI00053378E8|nr:MULTISPECIES: hypothetical protein [Prochlorococcus]KGG12716.1 hypothetical protein EV05_1934 [Prochlorococcus sp. MIT 0601]